jgi:hypothetical protein
MTLHEDQDVLYTAMKARWVGGGLEPIVSAGRWVEVDKSTKEWTVKLAELSGMWSKQTGELWARERRRRRNAEGHIVTAAAGKGLT